MTADTGHGMTRRPQPRRGPTAAVVLGRIPARRAAMCGERSKG